MSPAAFTPIVKNSNEHTSSWVMWTFVCAIFSRICCSVQHILENIAQTNVIMSGIAIREMKPVLEVLETGGEMENFAMHV